MFDWFSVYVYTNKEDMYVNIYFYVLDKFQSYCNVNFAAANSAAANSAASAPIVDLTEDDYKASGDNREVTFNKLSGKTYPSLVVVARPHLRIKDMSQAQISQERTYLGKNLQF